MWYVKKNKSLPAFKFYKKLINWWHVLLIYIIKKFKNYIFRFFKKRKRKKNVTPYANREYLRRIKKLTQFEWWIQKPPVKDYRYIFLNRFYFCPKVFTKQFRKSKFIFKQNLKKALFGRWLSKPFIQRVKSFS
jgi:hypothetical protein